MERSLFLSVRRPSLKESFHFLKIYFCICSKWELGLNWSEWKINTIHKTIFLLVNFNTRTGGGGIYYAPHLCLRITQTWQHSVLPNLGYLRKNQEFSWCANFDLVLGQNTKSDQSQMCTPGLTLNLKIVLWTVLIRIFSHFQDEILE